MFVKNFGNSFENYIVKDRIIVSIRNMGTIYEAQILTVGQELFRS